MNQAGHPVEQPVGQVEGGGLVAQSSQDLGQELPEWEGSVIGYVVGLVGEVDYE